MTIETIKKKCIAANIPFDIDFAKVIANHKGEDEKAAKNILNSYLSDEHFRNFITVLNSCFNNKSEDEQNQLINKLEQVKA